MAEEISPDTALGEFAGQLFFRLWRASHTRIAKALESLDLTPALFALLNLLGRADGANQQELGRAMAVDPSTMVSLIDELEAKGLAKRQPHPNDRRARAVVLTAKGRRVRERSRQMASTGGRRGARWAERRRPSGIAQAAPARARLSAAATPMAR